MRTIALVATLLVSACGGQNSDLLDANPSKPVSTDVVAADLSNRTFQFSNATVFGLDSSVLFRIGALTGTPPRGEFSLHSLSNSDEAIGTLTIAPCAFTVTTSNLGSNKVVAGAKFTLECLVDAKAVLHLRDPVTDVVNQSEACMNNDEEGTPCVVL